MHDLLAIDKFIVHFVMKEMYFGIMCFWMNITSVNGARSSKY